MRLPRFTILQMLLAAALVALILGLATSAWRTAKVAQITHLEYSPSGKYLAVKYSGGSIQVWDVSGARPRLTAQFTGSGFLNFDIGPICFADDSTLVDLQNSYSGNTYASMIRTMDLKSGRATMGPPIPFMSYAPSLAAGRQTVALPDWTGGAVEFYDLRTGKLQNAIKLPGSPWYLAMSDDEKYLAASDQNSGLCVVDLTTGKTLLTKTGATMLAGVDVKNGRLAAAIWSTPVTATGTMSVPPSHVELIDLPAAASSRTIKTSLGYITWLQLSADGSRLAVADYSAVEYYDVASGKRLTRIVMRGEDPESLVSLLSSFSIMGQNMALAPDGRTLASYSGGQITLRNLPSGNVRQTITGGWRSLQIAIFTLGFAGWAAAWGTVARRERLRRGERAPELIVATLVPPPYRPVSPPPPSPSQFWRAIGWSGLAVVLTLWLLSMDGSWSVTGMIGYALLLLVIIFLAAVVLAVGYSFLAPLVVGPHYLKLVRLRQIAHDPGRLQTSGNLTAVFFGPSNIEPQFAERTAAVIKQAGELFGGPVGLSRKTLIACLDRQCDLDAYMLRHAPIAAIVPNPWTARLALVCEETALRKLIDPSDAYSAALALLLSIQHKRGLLPDWTGTLVVQQIARCDRTAPGLPAAIRCLRVLAVRHPDWDPRRVLSRTARERAALWLAGDQPEAGREVQAEIDLLSTLGEMLLGEDAPAERRQKVLDWLRTLRPKDNPVESFTREVGLTLDQLVAEWESWSSAQSGLPYVPLPPEKVAAVMSLHLPTLRNRSLPVDERRLAARQIGYSGYAALAPLLLEQLHDPRCEFRYDVIEALENLSGQPLGDNHAAWQAWYSELPADVRAWPPVPAPAVKAEAPVEAAVLDGDPAVATPAPAKTSPARAPVRLSRPQLERPPLELRLCWGLMFLGGCAALVIPITLMFLWGPFYFPTIYFALVIGVLAVAKGAARETLGLKMVAKMQAASILACDPINMLLGSMEFNLLNRPNVLEYLIRANGGRL
jgi:hypothetical protein